MNITKEELGVDVEVEITEIPRIFAEQNKVEGSIALAVEFRSWKKEDFDTKEKCKIIMKKCFDVYDAKSNELHYTQDRRFVDWGMIDTNDLYICGILTYRIKDSY